MKKFNQGYIKILFTLLSCTICLLCFSQDAKTPVKNLDSILNRVDNKFKSGEDSLMKNLYALSKEDSTLRKALNEYQLFGLQNRMRNLEWNLTSGKIIFWCVIFLVFSGIVFAGLQFYRSVYGHKNITGTPAESLSTELEASLKGIKVSSPVLGVIILTLSLLFFYLYLVHVYPITEIF